MTSQPQQKPVNIVMLAFALGLITAIAAGLLVAVDSITKEPIRLGKVRATTEALKKVLPTFNNNPSEEAIIVGKNSDGKTIAEFEAQLKTNNIALTDTITFYPARNEGKLVAFAGVGKSPLGFGGDVKAMIGLDTNGTITQTIITQHQETPGLGTVVTDRVRQKTIFDILGLGEPYDESQLPTNATLDQFKGKASPTSPWKVSKDGGDIDYVTGATISSRAVADAFYSISKTFKANQEKILAKLAKKGGLNVTTK